MSADAWKPCPRCKKNVEEIFEKHKDNPDTPLNFEEIKNLERLKKGLDTGYPQNIDETDIEKEKLVSAEDKIREVDKYGDKPRLLPSSGNLRPVEIRYEYHVEEECAWFSLYAECRNCGHKYEVEKR